MQRTYSPEALARREARKAETKARNEAKRATEKAAKLAEIEKRNQQYAEERRQRREQFLTQMTEQDRADFLESLSIKTWEHDSSCVNGQRVFDEFTKSLQDQYHGKGFLSDKQRDILIQKVRKARQDAQDLERWPKIAEGDTVSVMCKVKSIAREQGAYGWSTKIRLTSHYGRPFILSTTSDNIIAQATAAQEADRKLAVQAKVKWVAPTGTTVVLTSRGAYVKKL